MVFTLTLDLLSFLIIGYFAFFVERQGWVKYSTVITNFVLMSGTIFPFLVGLIPQSIISPPLPINQYPQYLQLWLYGFIVATLLAFLIIKGKMKTTPLLRDSLYLLYSSKTLFGVLLAVLINPYFPNSLQYSLAIVLGVWAFAVIKLNHKLSGN